jgi:hypothetical protein
MPARDRLALFNALTALPPPQFGQLVFALNPPAGVVPGSGAAQGDRVSALLSWAESLSGCGLVNGKQSQRLDGRQSVVIGRQPQHNFLS